MFEQMCKMWSCGCLGCKNIVCLFSWLKYAFLARRLRKEFGYKAFSRCNAWKHFVKGIDGLNQRDRNKDLFIVWSIYLSIYLSIHIFIYLFNNPSIYHVSIFLCVYPSIYLSIYLSNPMTFLLYIPNLSTLLQHLAGQPWCTTSVTCSKFLRTLPQGTMFSPGGPGSFENIVFLYMRNISISHRLPFSLT